jgi:hypothetical protein
MTERLKLISLFEMEVLHNRSVDREGFEDIAIENTLTLQLGLQAEITDFASIEVVVEYDSDENRFLTEELFLTIEDEPWEVSLGRQFTPFGTYFSRFVTAPMLEFGETQADNSIALTYGPSDALDLTLMYYRGAASKLDSSHGQWNWSLGLEAWPQDGLSIGLSYQADLADSDERLLADWRDRYSNRVAGVSGYLFYLNREYEFSLEFLAAIASFKEFEAGQDKPAAWNWEVSRYFAHSNIEIALRIENSRELADVPTQRFGISLTNYVDHRASFTIEYLHGRFGKHAIFSDEDESLDHVDFFGAKVDVEL